ncbi:MAG TPA: hypothetical protein VFZ81_06240, partial [Burkholderiales bacterium]
AFALPAWSAPFAVQLGDARVALDAPAGYADTTFTGSPRLQELAEALTSASNRVLLFAVSDGDLRRFTLGDPPEFRRYMLVATPKALERERIEAPAFQRMAGEALRGFAAVPEGTELASYLETQPVGLSRPLSALRRDPAVVSLLQGTRLEPTRIPRLFGSDERQNFMLSSSTLMLVGGKALNVYVFSAYHSAEDAAWVRAVTARWVDDLQRLNGR